jgi:hypothetical protein
MNRGEVEAFFKTLLLGDFEENQNSAAMLVGGLLGLIPVLDQVLDARDITGAMFNINKKGGFKNASADQLVNLGFAAFGAIPEVGSAFKGVFKPLWKERRLAKGAVHSGLQAIEALLGMSKGGAIGWIRKELIGKWGSRTNQAIQAVNAALAASIELTEFIATASGWKDWLIPDPIQELAKQILPGMKALQGKINEPLQRASNEIREFLQDLLGEQAAAMVMAVGGRAVQASAVPATRPRAGHNAAAVSPQVPIPKRQKAQKVADKPKVQAKKAAGPISTAVQITRKAFGKLASQEKGLIGEHMVDYWELKRLQGDWPHDKSKAKWSPSTVQKINVDKRPVNLSIEDLPKVNHAGLDAVWDHDGKYTVTEAKASESVGAVFGFGKYKEKKGIIPTITGVSEDHKMLHYVLSDSSDKGGTVTPLMQMSVGWVEDRAKREGIGPTAAKSLSARNSNSYFRRVVLVTIESKGGLDHGKALTDIHLGKSPADVHAHAAHGVTKEWEAAAINAVDKARLKAHELKKSQPKPDEPDAKPAKTRKPRK